MSTSQLVSKVYTVAEQDNLRLLSTEFSVSANFLNVANDLLKT